MGWASSGSLRPVLSAQVRTGVKGDSLRIAGGSQAGIRLHKMEAETGGHGQHERCFSKLAQSGQTVFLWGVSGAW